MPVVVPKALILNRRVQVRLDKKTSATLKRAADKDIVSPSQYVRRIIIKHLKMYEAKHENV